MRWGGKLGGQGAGRARGRRLQARRGGARRRPCVARKCAEGMWVPIRGASACFFSTRPRRLGTLLSGPRSKLAAPIGLGTQFCQRRAACCATGKQAAAAGRAGGGSTGGGPAGRRALPAPHPGQPTQANRSSDCQRKAPVKAALPRRRRSPWRGPRGPPRPRRSLRPARPRARPARTWPPARG